LHQVPQVARADIRQEKARQNERAGNSETNSGRRMQCLQRLIVASYVEKLLAEHLRKTGFLKGDNPTTRR
jgi:hypothetical protein